MNHTKLIHQFFDGGIDGAEEEHLFTALAGDRELRREFVEHLKISSFIQHDTSKTGPPPEVSNAVFAAIGLPQPGAPFEEHDESTWQKLGVLIQRILPFAATIFITAAVTSGVLLLDSGSRTRIDNAGPAVTVNTMSDAASSSLSESSDEVLSSGETGIMNAGSSMADSPQSGSVSEPAHEHIAPASAIVPPARTSTVQQTAIVNPEKHRGESIASVPTAETALAGTLSHTDIQNIEIAPVAIPEAPDVAFNTAVATGSLREMPIGQTPFTIANMIFQLRHVGLNASLPDVGLQTPTEGVFRDLTISGLYKLSEQHAIGFSYGREAFGRIYVRTVLDKNITYTETLQVSPDDFVKEEMRDLDMLDWGGITWKMSHPSLGIFHTFYPYTEITAAVSKYGPMGRAMVGIELYPSNASMINLGIELSSLGYKIEDKYYTSNKIGGSIGIALSL